MRKQIAFILAAVCVLLITGCGASKIMSESYSLTLGELKESEDKELIGNQIPQWVADADWTQKQSDRVYLGQGIEMFALDDAEQVSFLTVRTAVMFPKNLLRSL